jgi:cupin 2 domain-containing protein
MTAVESGNIFASIAERASDEALTTLLETDGLRVERIVSHGHTTPEGVWYDQEWAEWVMVVRGTAELLFAHESAPRVLRSGDYVHIPPHVRHRVSATDPGGPTVWLALHHR